MPQKRDIIVIGASAGGVEALVSIVASLDPDIPAAIFIVIHVPATHRSKLPEVLGRAGRLPVVPAVDNDTIQRGRIYTARPDFHLLIGGGTVHVARGPRVNRSRPAIDLLFQSASAAHGPRVISVIASGMLDDGTRGLATVKRRGGITIVQDPDDAAFSGMPRNAQDNVDVDFTLPASEIGKKLNELVTEPIEGGVLMHDRPRTDMLSSDNPNNRRDISAFTCPECSGTLWEIEEGALVHYQCRVGHSFTPSALLASQVDEVEALLWSALRAMEERDNLYRLLVERDYERGSQSFGGTLQERIETNNRHAEMIRQILLGEETMSAPVTSNDE